MEVHIPPGRKHLRFPSRPCAQDAITFPLLCHPWAFLLVAASQLLQLRDVHLCSSLKEEGTGKITQLSSHESLRLYWGRTCILRDIILRSVRWNLLCLAEGKWEINFALLLEFQ